MFFHSIFRFEQEKDFKVCKQIVLFAPVADPKRAMGLCAKPIIHILSKQEDEASLLLNKEWTEGNF